MKPTVHVVVLVTASGRDEAEKITAALLDGRQAACVNIVPSVISRFWWKGRIDSADEALLIIKTRQTAVADVITTVKRNHSYSVPEIIVLPIIGGSEEYLNWIAGEVPE
ncbi:MAG: divalent-cation tolerance protein CutA [Chloroflexi bacterium]|nr:divalent-cation tolerance protein CutA [Chloroflexota bacterium]